MKRDFLLAKLHGVVVTESDVNYEGSVSIDKDLLDQSGMKVYEKVLAVNLRTSARAETYIIPAERGSRTIGMNGGMAHLFEVGDKVLIITFCSLDEHEYENHHPKVLIFGENNQIVKVK